MDWLTRNAAIIALDDLVSGNWPASRSGIVCSITFDDGYASVYRFASPILAERNIPATVYLVAGAIHQDVPQSSNQFDGLYPNEDMLIWPEVRELNAHSIRMGSHLLHHQDLTSLDADAAERELLDSKKTIEDHTGSDCSSFCFPWGKHNSSTVEAVRRAGYSNSVITIQGRWRKNDALDHYRIPRADIRRDYTLDDFKAVVRGDWDYLGHIQRLRRAMS
jgi:peptidoglycan/xylan/chitin deacetylase (PgdA/CDA1 family)